MEQTNRPSDDISSTSSLARCRSACLQLHEDATSRLRESMATDREKVSQELHKQLEALRWAAPVINSRQEGG